MRRKTKVVRTYGASHRKRYAVIAVILVIAAVFGFLIAVNVFDEYHTYRSSEATAFENVEEERDGFLLTTETKTLLGKVYAGFSVADAESSKVVYQCPDLYLVKDLKSIGWGTEQDSIAVVQKDGAVITYIRDGERWKKQE